MRVTIWVLCLSRDNLRVLSLDEYVLDVVLDVVSCVRTAKLSTKDHSNYFVWHNRWERNSEIVL